MTRAWLALLLLASTAQAQERRSRLENWHLGAEVLTDFPMQIGARVWVEFPHRLRLDTSFGGLPGPYVDVINDILVAANAYNQQTADLIKEALQSSLLWRIHFGWRPFKRRGFYFEGGYGLVALGGGATTAELITAVTGKPAPPDVNSSKGYNVTSLLHMIDLEIGWQWFVWRGLSLRAAAGFAGTVGAQTTVAPNFKPIAANAQQQFGRAAGAYLDNIYTSYVFVPVVSVAIGWRFF